MHTSALSELDRPGTSESPASGIRTRHLHNIAKPSYAGNTLYIAALHATLPASAVWTVTSSYMSCSEEYDETCRIGTGVAPPSALVWRMSLCTSWKLLMADPAGAGMTGIKFGQKGLFRLTRALSGARARVCTSKSAFPSFVTDREDAVDRGWKHHKHDDA